MRRDDDVEIPSLTLDRDEVQGRGRGSSNSSQAARQRLNPPPAHPAAAYGVQSSGSQSKQSLAFVYFLLLLIFSGMGAGGYWLWMENQNLRDELLGARSQIQDLDSQLVAADVSNSELGATVEETLKTHDSEIRKLWVVANERNKKSLEDHSQQLKSLDGKLAALNDSLTTQTTRIAVQGDAFNVLENGHNRLVETVSKIEAGSKDVLAKVQESEAKVTSQLSRQASDVAAQLDRVAKFESQIASINKSIALLEAKVKEQSVGLASVATAPVTNTAAPDGLEKRLKSNEEAIRSIDEFRPQVLREIDGLKAQIRQLSLQLSLNGGG